MILLNLDKKSSIPLYKQVFEQLRTMIDNETLKEGDVLPSTRGFAKELSVNRTTIYRAYEELWAQGYIESKSGSYSTVRKPAKVVTIDYKEKKQIINWNDIFERKPNLTGMYSQVPTVQKNFINFIPLSPDPKLIPVQKFKQCLNNVLIQEGPDLLQYGNSSGYQPLREYIAKQMQKHSINISVDEIILTNGCQNAIDLILKLLITEGDKILVESPTYSSAIPLFGMYGADIIGIPVKANGVDLEILENQILKHKPSLFYTMPNFHNPTGITSDQIHRENLLEICKKHKVPILEDGFVEEMKYFGKAVLPIKSMDKYNIVFYLGTFSKILFPGLRIGWIAADKKCISMLSNIAKVNCISGNILNQAALLKFCKLGYYDIHVKRMHRVYKKRMMTALRAVSEYIPKEHFTYTKPFGGYSLWIKAKNDELEQNEIINLINKQGVAVSPGNIHFSEPQNKCYFRISIAHTDENEIKEGIKKIGKALKILTN